MAKWVVRRKCEPHEQSSRSIANSCWYSHQINHNVLYILPRKNEHNKLCITIQDTNGIHSRKCTWFNRIQLNITVTSHQYPVTLELVSVHLRFVTLVILLSIPYIPRYHVGVKSSSSSNNFCHSVSWFYFRSIQWWSKLVKDRIMLCLSKWVLRSTSIRLAKRRVIPL